jgi:hypothetical protein
LKPHLHAGRNSPPSRTEISPLTGKTVSQQFKEPYVPAWAREKAAEDASDFIGKRIRQAHQLREISVLIRRSSRRPTMPSFTGTGGLKVRSSLIFCFANCISTRTKSKPLRPAIFSTSDSDSDSAAVGFFVGRKRLLQSLAQRRKFVDVSLPARRRTKNDGFGESV